jgi:hypothetical protein
MKYFSLSSGRLENINRGEELGFKITTDVKKKSNF